MLPVSSLAGPCSFRIVRSRPETISVLRESEHHGLDVLAALLADPLAEVDTLQALHDRPQSEQLEIRYIHQKSAYHALTMHLKLVQGCPG